MPSTYFTRLFPKLTFKAETSKLFSKQDFNAQAGKRDDNVEAAVKAVNILVTPVAAENRRVAASARTGPLRPILRLDFFSLPLLAGGAASTCVKLQASPLLQVFGSGLPFLSSFHGLWKWHMPDFEEASESPASEVALEVALEPPGGVLGLVFMGQSRAK